MTDAKQEALRMSIQYHQAAALIVQQNSTPTQIVDTAKKFEAFLDPHGKKR